MTKNASGARARLISASIESISHPHPLHVRVNYSAKGACHGRTANDQFAAAWAALAEESTVTSAPRPGAWSMEVGIVDELASNVCAARRVSWRRRRGSSGA